jgi:hypothetical protein
MTLRVTFDVNGERIYILDIQNHGVAAAGTDLRYYRWNDSDGYHGTTVFDRSDGAQALVRQVLEEIADER